MFIFLQFCFRIALPRDLRVQWGSLGAICSIEPLENILKTSLLVSERLYRPNRYQNKIVKIISFSKFEYSAPKVSKNTLSSVEDTVDVTVNVTNKSNVDGEEVVQLYINDQISSFTRPVKELKGYKRVAIKAGETKAVTITINAESLAFYDKDYNFVVEPGDFTIMTGSSSADKDLKKITISAPSLLMLEKAK